MQISVKNAIIVKLSTTLKTTITTETSAISWESGNEIHQKKVTVTVLSSYAG